MDKVFAHRDIATIFNPFHSVLLFLLFKKTNFCEKKSNRLVKRETKDKNVPYYLCFFKEYELLYLFSTFFSYYPS